MGQFRFRATSAIAIAILLTMPMTAVGGHVTDPVVNVTTDTGYGSIQSAIAAASAGDTIVVRPGDYAGPITIDESVTLCSTASSTGVACDGTYEHVSLDGGANIYPVFITADDVHFQGFRVSNPTFRQVDQDFGRVDPSLVVVFGADDVVLDGLHLSFPASPLLPTQSRWITDGVNVASTGGDKSDRVVIRNSVFENFVTGVGPDGTCTYAPCRMAAIDLWGAGATPTIRDNVMTLPAGRPEATTPEVVGVWGNAAGATVSYNTISTLDNVPRGMYGVKGTYTSSDLGGNTISGALHGIFVAGSDLDVSDNVFTGNGEGLRITARNSDLTGNVFELNNIAVRIAAPNGGPEATGLVLRENGLGDNRLDLAIHQQVSGVSIDARENDWGVYSADLIRTFIDDESGANSVDIRCFIDEDGSTRVCPPTADFTSSGSSWSAPFAFADASTGNPRDVAAWAWDFDGLGSSAQQNPSFAFSTPGTYDVTLTVTDEEGFTGTVTKPVSVIGDPVLAPIGAKSINLANARRLAFTVSAQDPDSTPTFSAGPLPGTAAFDPSNRTFWWYPTVADVGVYPVTFTVTDGTYTDSETISVSVVRVGATRIVTTPVGPTVKQASPGEDVTFTFNVRNDALDADFVTFGRSVPLGWTGSVDPASALLAPGETRAVTLTVRGDAATLSAAVLLQWSAASGGSGATFAHLTLPVTLALLDARDATLTTPAVGSVQAKWLNGQHATGAKVLFSERSAVHQVSLLSTPDPVEYGSIRTLVGTVGADGKASFSYPVSATASNSPRDHVVRASVVGLNTPGSTAKDTYFVS